MVDKQVYRRLAYEKANTSVEDIIAKATLTLQQTQVLDVAVDETALEELEREFLVLSIDYLRYLKSNGWITS
jgi:hypothetical protein